MSRISCLYWMMFCCALVVPPLQGAEGRCWVVAVAMNQDAQASEDWNQYGEEFALVFQNHGEEIFDKVHTKTVLGREARLGAIASALNWAASNARQGDFLAVYIGAHGGTSPKEGWSTGTMDNKSLMGRDLKLMASRLPCPVLFVIDTCGSGGFAREHAQDIALPANCIAICSSRAQQSTTNVLNIALHEGLWGIADSNQDSAVNVQELTRYIQARCRRIAPPGESIQESEVPVVVVGQAVPSDLKLVQVSGEQVAVLHAGSWQLARLKKETDDVCELHVMGAQDDPQKGFYVLHEAPRNKVFKLNQGIQPVMVEEENRARPALLLKIDASGATVRFPGAPRKGEVVVERSRVRFPFPVRGNEPAAE